MAKHTTTYVGIDNETNAGMTPIANIIRDAWVFGLIEETETCEGWNGAGLDSLLDKVNDEWDKYGCLVSNLPAELAEKHKRIYDDAIEEAKKNGWKPGDRTGEDG